MKYRGLDETINNKILNYPLLYKCENYKASRIQALNDIFVVGGSGYNVHPKGFMFDDWDKDFKRIEEIPDFFFDLKLYRIEIRRNELHNFMQYIFPNYFYIIERSKNKLVILFSENNATKAKEIISSKYNISEYTTNLVEQKSIIPSRPYFIDHTSKIHKALKEEIILNDDWILGGIELMKHYKMYYYTENYILNKPMLGSELTEEQLQEIDQTQRSIVEAFLIKFNQ